MTFKTQTKTLTPALLEEQLEAFLTRELPRRETLYDYYQGAQPVRKGPAVPGRPNNLLSANYAKYISDVHTGYFMGVAPTLTFEGKRIQDHMTRALDSADLHRMLFAAARDMSVCGEGYLLTYLSQKGPRLARLDPRETVVLTHGVEEEIWAAVRLGPEGKGRTREGEVYLPGQVRAFVLEGKRISLGAARALPLEGLAVTRFCNNGECRGDFEPVLTLLDAYNILLSGAMDDMQSVANAFLALYGVQDTLPEDIDAANRSRVLCLGDNGKAEFVVKDLSPDAIALLKGTLVQDLLSITMTPNLGDDAFAGNSSGVALEYKLWGVEQARSAKEQGFSGGLYHIIGLFFQALRQMVLPAGGACSARFYKNLPQDRTRLCEDLKTLGDTVSRRTKLELLPFVSDPEEEEARIRAEQRGEEEEV